MNTPIVLILCIAAASSSPLYFSLPRSQPDPGVIRRSCPNFLFLNCPSVGLYQHPLACTLDGKKPCKAGFKCCTNGPDLIFFKNNDGCCVEFYKTTQPPTQQSTQPPSGTSERPRPSTEEPRPTEVPRSTQEVPRSTQEVPRSTQEVPRTSESAVPETLPPVVETSPPVVETQPPAVETEAPLPESTVIVTEVPTEVTTVVELEINETP